MRNLDVRQAIEESGLRYWQVAYAYGVEAHTIVNYTEYLQPFSIV